MRLAQGTVHYKVIRAGTKKKKTYENMRRVSAPWGVKRMPRSIYLLETKIWC